MRSLLSRFHRFHRDQAGSPTIFALTAMVGLILPMTAVLYMTASVSNSSQAAQGIAYSVAYATMNRSVDLQATADANGGIVLRQDDPAVYQEARDAVSMAAQVAASGIGGTTLSLQPVGDVAPYRPATDALGFNPDVGIISISAGPETNRNYVNGVERRASCDGGLRTNAFNGDEPACWTDMRAANVSDGRYSRDPVGADGGRSPAWDHYVSGAEAMVRYDMPTWMFGDFSGVHRGVASFGRPCDVGNCTQ